MRILVAIVLALVVALVAAAWTLDAALHALFG